MLLAIDPGPTESAFVMIGNGKLRERMKCPNEKIIGILDGEHEPEIAAGIGDIVIEQIASYGMPVGAEVFETCVWSGRFIEAAHRAGARVHRITRKEVGLHLCNSPRANDSTVRQALIDRYGGKAKAIGTVKNKGPLYGVSGDVWSALAVGCVWMDRQAN